MAGIPQEIDFMEVPNLSPLIVVGFEGTDEVEDMFHSEIPTHSLRVDGFFPDWWLHPGLDKSIWHPPLVPHTWVPPMALPVEWRPPLIWRDPSADLVLINRPRAVSYTHLTLPTKRIV